jgi:outer membrane receptor protein involved in Fe transport
MLRYHLLASAGTVALLSNIAPAMALEPTPQTIETVVVTAQQLDAARLDIQTQTGASTYTLTQDDIKNQPGGDNSSLNQVILQAPGVSQDSFGQIHVRGEHNGLQYRLNGILIPEGISVFGQTLDPRFISSLKLITGALPAEYGDRTAGIIDMQTKTGQFDNGGDVGIYGGSHSTLTPSFDYGGSTGSINYFVSGDYTTNGLGIESPDGKSDPLHDRTKQYHGFGYVQDILDSSSSISAVLGVSNDMFQIPNQAGLQPSGLGGINGLGPNGVLQVGNQTTFPSENLDERQRELTQYGIVSYLHSQGAFDFQVSGFGRYSSLYFTPSPVGDLLYTGIAQTAYKRDKAYGIQADGTWRLNLDHTIRAGLIYQADDLDSQTGSEVLPLDANDNQTSTIPLLISGGGTKHATGYSLYVQDEWRIAQSLTLNYGLRYDAFDAYDSENQLSPRVNIVWTPGDITTVHLGYARYFSPPPIELVADSDIAAFAGTTGAAPGTLNDTPKAERADYYDAGISVNPVQGLTIGLDSFYKLSRNLVDEGQFGAPIILTPFNYLSGRQYGGELTGAYNNGDFSAYLNTALEHAAGRDIVSSQFDIDPSNLAYIANHFIPLDHQQLITISSGVSYNWEGTMLSGDFLYGSGLRRDGITPNGDSVPDYAAINLGISRTFTIAKAGKVTARFDIINALDAKYEIRDGTGVGVGAPQFGARRGFFFGLSKAL